MEGDEGGIFSKASDGRPLFLLKIKIKQNPSCQIRNMMQSSSTFTILSGPISMVKKSALANDYENIIVYWEESEQSKVWVVLNKFGNTFFQIHLVPPQENFAIFTLI